MQAYALHTSIVEEDVCTIPVGELRMRKYTQEDSRMSALVASASGSREVYNHTWYGGHDLS